MPDALKDVTRTVDAESIRLYAEITQDFNPLHLDRAFAATTPFGVPIAHGTMQVSLIWQSLMQTFGAARMAGTRLDIRFLKPVKEGDTVTGGGRVVDAAAGRCEVWVLNAAGETVIGGTATVPAAT